MGTMGRRIGRNRKLAITYPSRCEGWLDVCEVEGQSTNSNLPFGPLYCVLQQDEQTFTAYCSEELSLTDILFAELPRVRLDRVAKRNYKTLWDGPPTVNEEPEDSDGGGGVGSGGLSSSDHIGLNTTLDDLGEFKYKSKTLPRLHLDEPYYEDTSYEKACRRGSAPATPIMGQKSEQQQQQQTTSRFTNFFSKRSNPLKRTKSVTKLERAKRGPGGGLRGSRSHESLLSSHAVMSTIDLSCTGAVGVAPVHQSVLGRRHCFQVRGGPRGERYYSCGSRQERDLWIYSLRKSIAPNSEHTRRTDNSLRMWIYEAKALPPKKKYFCEINLDKTLYGRTSVKLRTDLLFWGEYFDFPDIPDINVIHVNVFRECDKKKKRDKHVLVGTVKIPIHEVTSRTISEDWYAIVSEKHDSISRNSSKEPIPTLRIKCRFQCIDILPIEIYTNFLDYLKENYKKVCEILEPVIGVKAKEDIGQALVLLMHAQGCAGAFLTDVVALDLLRVGDQRLTFRGNSLATKSMEAFLKLTGEQYLQDTLSTPISEIIASERDCEVDPLKATGSLSRQQQALRNAVRVSWNAIAQSHKLFPTQLRDCFATFRERLQMLDREDMADNLISASIFLRFLCPAILSPSLFNITSELPSGRATRNLTLVAKTLQTLANFTRFQGKENFMEFLNDFLEQEAPKMKEFLHLISTRSDNATPETILDWSGYIDQGKQLSILHSLLSESFQKLQTNRQQELSPLMQILDDIQKAKELNTYTVLSQQTQENHHQQQQQQQHHQNGLRNGERGIMRGVLTPSSLEKNIFRYNDPTVSPLLSMNHHHHLQHHQSQNSLQHSHSTSSISSTTNYQLQTQPLTNGNGNILIPTTVQNFINGEKQHGSNSSSNKNNNRNIYNGTTSSSSSTVTIPTSQQYYNTTSSSERKSPLHQQQQLTTSAISGNIRANTLPRNNNNNNNNQMISTIEIRNNNDEINTNLIQIGLDPSSAFLQKSPTPLMKSTLCNGVGNRTKNLNGSQLSLLSERSLQNHSKNSLGLNLSLGIPHCDPIINNTNQSNMPMNLEDLEDLIKYADEQQNEQQQKDIITQNKKGGSNISIGQLSNHGSSGYQSITTQSQSSSPIEQNIDFITNKNSRLAALTNGKYQYIQNTTKYSNQQQQQQQSSIVTSTTQSINNSNGLNAGHAGPLAFKNPLYHVSQSSSQTQSQQQQQLHHHSTSLTPSSSEEHLSNDNYCGVEIVGVHHLKSLTNGFNNDNNDKELSLSLLNGSRRYGSSGSSGNGVGISTSIMNRLPRTNPLMQYKQRGDDQQQQQAHESLTSFINSTSRNIENNNHNHLRYQRRLSLESARTLSDSSTDTEGLCHTEGKRRRAGRSVEQCERQIERLQASVDSLRHKLEESDLRDSNDDLLALAPHSDSKMRSIISRLINMEEELRREQLKMSLALTHKQRVIEAQGQQIAALDAANNRLLSALASLRQRYETQQTITQSASSSSSSTTNTTTTTMSSNNSNSNRIINGGGSIVGGNNTTTTTIAKSASSC